MVDLSNAAYRMLVVALVFDLLLTSACLIGIFSKSVLQPSDSDKNLANVTSALNALFSNVQSLIDSAKDTLESSAAATRAANEGLAVTMGDARIAIGTAEKALAGNLESSTAATRTANEDLAATIGDVRSAIGTAEKAVAESTSAMKQATESFVAYIAANESSKQNLDADFMALIELLAGKIGAIEEIDKENVSGAAQLWREAQLALEATVGAPDSKEITSLRRSIQDLQSKLFKAMPGLIESAYAEARSAPTLRDGLTKWAGAGAYLAMVPNDGTVDSAEIAQSMGYEHEVVRQDLLQKAQVKYNLWACEQIKKAWVDIKDVNSAISKSDNPKFYHTCVHFLAPIDSTLVSMSTGELYREILQFVRDRMPMEDFQQLVQEVEKSEKRSLDTE